MKEKNNQIDGKKVEKNNEKLNELKIELLKQVQKRKGIKKEIARILTQTKCSSNTPSKLNRREQRHFRGAQNKIVSKIETKEKK